MLGHLRHLQRAGKTVFVVEYTGLESQRKGIRKAGSARGFITLFTTRELGELGQSGACAGAN